ncbi:MAG: V-type ATP synthase subunit E family protein [Caulobacteraceae bacterium]
MSVSIEDKIELFRKMIFSDIESNSSDKKQKLSEKFEEEKNELLKEAEQKKNTIVEEAAKKAEKEKKQLISKVQAEQYHRVLSQRQEFISGMIELLKAEAINFTNSDSYRKYVADNLRKATDFMKQSQTIHYFFTKKDLERYGEFINDTITKLRGKDKYALEEAGKSIIGGFYAEDDKQLMQVDYTLRSLIEENRELIGSNISHRLDEVTF